MKGQTEPKSIARDLRFAKDYGGPRVDEFSGKPKEAIAKLMDEKRGYVPEAFYHPEIGHIDLVWGNKNYGLAHILHKHDPKILGRLEAMLKKGEVNVVKYGENAEVRLGNNKAVVALQWRGESKSWLLTAFDMNERKGRFS
ncbi:DarB-like antirestriction protein, partial [Aduncisulcus paluster]